MRDRYQNIIVFSIVMGVVIASIINGVKASKAFLMAMIMLTIYIVMKLAWGKFKKFLMEFVEDIKAK